MNSASGVRLPVVAPGDKVMQIENDYDKEVYNGAARIAHGASLGNPPRLVGHACELIEDPANVRKKQLADRSAILVVRLGTRRRQ